MRTKKAIYNAITSILLQLVTAVCGFILPSLMIRSFGSEANGAVASIGQFLGYISLIESGVGGVARAALYGPLANKDTNKISGIIVATEKFFRKIAGIFIVYALVIATIYPYITKSELDWVYTFVLVIIIALATFAQYYFGITYSVLLNADQGLYIVNLVQILTTVLNTVIAVVLIHFGCSLHIVKLFSAFIFVVRPIVLGAVVKKKYKIDGKVLPDNQAIKARWNGLGHHIAYFLHNNIDIFLVSIVLGLKSVSVYSVYYMITSSINRVISSVTGGVEAAFGNMIAQKERETLDGNFRLIETIASFLSVLFFSITLVLIFDFIKIYTAGVTDTEYYLPLFGVLIVVSEALHCLKNVYHSVVLAAGHYKETQIGAFIEAGLNILFSVVAVFLWGLPGVIIGTIIATMYRMIDYSIYLRKNILRRSIKVFLKRHVINILNFLLVVGVCYLVPFFQVSNYMMWFIKAIIVGVIALVVTGLINCIFYKEDIKRFVDKLKGLIRKNGNTKGV